MPFARSRRSSRKRLRWPALLVVLGVRVALWLLPYRAWKRGAETLRRFTCRLTPEDATSEDVARIVARVSRRVAYASCLTQAIATWLLLPRVETTAHVRIGVRRAGVGGLQAHAWVETDAGVLIGGGDAGAYAPLMHRRHVEAVTGDPELNGT